jgi:hypothetical protein
MITVGKAAVRTLMLSSALDAQFFTADAAHCYSEGNGRLRDQRSEDARYYPVLHEEPASSEISPPRSRGSHCRLIYVNDDWQ